MSNPRYKISETISAQNTFTNPVEILGPFTIEISGGTSSTVHIQRRIGDSGSWSDLTDANGTVLTWTSDAVFNLQENTRGVQYRGGIKTGNYTDDATITISQ